MKGTVAHGRGEKNSGAALDASLRGQKNTRGPDIGPGRAFRVWDWAEPGIRQGALSSAPP